MHNHALGRMLAESIITGNLSDKEIQDALRELDSAGFLKPFNPKRVYEVVDKEPDMPENATKLRAGLDHRYSYFWLGDYLLQKHEPLERGEPFGIAEYSLLPASYWDKEKEECVEAPDMLVDIEYRVEAPGLYAPYHVRWFTTTCLM